MFATPWGALFIFCLRIVDVSLDTMRVLFAIRGKRAIAGVLGFFQALIWIFAVGTAIQHLDSWFHVFGYAGGYAMGTFVGITIERAVAYGLATVRIVSQHGGVEIANCVVQRAHLDEVIGLIDRWDPDAFVTVEEPRVLRGGSLVAREWKMTSPLARWSGRPHQRA